MAKGKKKITPGEAVAAISCGMDRHRCCGKYGHKIIVIDSRTEVFTTETIEVLRKKLIEKLTSNCLI